MATWKIQERSLTALLLPVVLLVCLAYSGSLNYPFHFDDRTNIVENRALRVGSLKPSDVRRFLLEQPPSAINRPVANVTFAIQMGEGSDGTFWLHAVNLLIHAVNVFLLAHLFLACLNLADPIGGTRNRLCSLAAAALWGASPLHTESVTYLVQRATSLGALFFLCACLLFTRGLTNGTDGAPRFGGGRIAGILGFFFLSAGTKENGLLLPFAMAILLAILPFPGKKPNAYKLVLALCFSGLALAATLGFSLVGTDALTWRVLGAGGYGPAERVMTQPLVLLWYLSLLLFPFPGRLNIDIDFPVSRWLLSPPAILAVVFWAVAVFLAAKWRKKHPLYSLAVSWYLALSAMEASFLNLEMAFLHRTYLPSAFLFLMAADAVLPKPSSSVKGPSAGMQGVGKGLIAIGLVFCLFLALTSVRNRAFASSVALWEDATGKSPHKARPWFNLGRSYQEADRLREAEASYRRAVEIDPAYFRPYANLAVLLEGRGDLEEAWELMKRAYRLGPGDGEVLYNMGRYSFMRGRLGEAADFLGRSLGSRDLVVRGDAHWYLALIAEQKGDMELAKSEWTRAMAEYGPGSARGKDAKVQLERLP